MTIKKEVVQATLTIYKGLPFQQTFLYQTADGRALDLTGKKGRLQIRLKVDDPDPPIYDFSDDNGKMELGAGYITISGMTAAETLDFDWEQAVGHLVIDEAGGAPRPVAYLLFNVQPVTTGVPD